MSDKSVPFASDKALPDATSYRHQILEQLIENKEGMQIDELSKCLGISRTAVQKHFLLLEKEGLIRKHNRIKTLGRPSIGYVLTDRGLAYFPKRYAMFSEILLQELKNEMGQDRLIDFMQTMGRKLAHRYRGRFAGKAEDEQISTLYELMQELGFHANLHYETDHPVVEIKAHNCIFHDLAQQFPEICSLDEAMINELMGKPPELRSCMAKGDSACCFRMDIGKNKA
jgi:predicted ArsR family transcriptional regulator